MIIQQLANSTPRTINSGIATQTEVASLPNIQPTETNDFCICDVACEYTEKVFAKIGEEWWKNDKSSYLYQKMILSDTITINIKKNDIILTTITDNTYGEYYPGFPSKPKYVYFVLYWENVFNDFGAGRYTVEVVTDILGTETTDEYRYFLLEYNDLDADGTTRIEYNQTGNILNSEFNYSDLISGGIYSSFRINGMLFPPKPVKEVDKYLNSSYEQEQIREKITREWTLRMKQLPSSVNNAIVYGGGLANKFYVTDYNLRNHEVYRRKDLYVESIDLGENRIATELSYVINFTDRIDDIVKVNF